MSMTHKATLMTTTEINRALTRIAHEIAESKKGAQNLALVGIHTRGVPIAEHLAGLIESFESVKPMLSKRTVRFKNEFNCLY